MRQFSFYKKYQKQESSFKAPFWKYLTPLVLGAATGAFYLKSDNEISQNSYSKFTQKILNLTEETKVEWAADFEQKPDVMKTRVNILQLPANYPCEDRFDAHQLKSSNGYSVAVFDGNFLL